jgi:RND family efflux transporter MFP subunit
VDLVKVDPLRFRADVPERDAAHVRAGQEIRISAEGQPAVTARLTRLSPTISDRNRVVAVEADVANPGGLRPGSFVRAEIVTDATEKALTVPNDAVVSFAGIQKVMVVRDGKAEEQPVVVGRRTPEWTEVTSGLKAGEQVVLKPGSLQSGQPVTVATAEAARP